MTYLAKDAAAELEEGNTNSYDMHKISKIAFGIYRDHGFMMCEELNIKLLELMAMDEGPEFEMNEKEFLELVSEIKSM